MRLLTPEIVDVARQAAVAYGARLGVTPRSVRAMIKARRDRGFEFGLRSGDYVWLLSPDEVEELRQAQRK